MDFTTADNFIALPHIQRLSTSDQEVHANLWPTFSQLVATAGVAESGWKYERSFQYAIDAVKREYNLTSNSRILEDKAIQCRLGFHFIMHIYH
jgi:hypothetical protein